MTLVAVLQMEQLAQKGAMFPKRVKRLLPQAWSRSLPSRYSGTFRPGGRRRLRPVLFGVVGS